MIDVGGAGVKRTATIGITLRDPFVQLKPESFLGTERFADYRAAVEGSRFDWDSKAYLASTDKLAAILGRLRRAGFAVEVDREVRHSLLRINAVRWSDLVAAEDRIAWLDARIREASGGRESMFPFQRTGSLWLTLRMGALLADEQGCGKTLEFLAAIPANAPVLVIAPASLKGVWLSEIRRWRPQLRVTIITGRGNLRWPEPGEVVVVNPDILPDGHGTRADGTKCDGKLPPEACAGCFRGESGRAIPGRHVPSCDARGNVEEDRRRCEGCHPFLGRVLERTVVIIDEAHMFRGSRSQRNNKARCLCRAARLKGGRTWLGTGTPLVNDPSELWNVLEIADLAREAFGSYREYLALFSVPEPPPRKGPDWSLAVASPEVAERMRRVSMRRMRRDVLPELPAKLYRSIPVEIDKATIRACDSWLREQGKSVEDVAKLLREDKIPFTLMAKVRAALATAKIPAMIEEVKRVEEEVERLIVFSAHRAPIDVLARRPGWAVITGDVKVEERMVIVRDFQAGKYKGIGLTIAAGGVGLTLTAAHLVLFVDRDFTPAGNAQAEDRAARIGQTRGVIITTLVADHPLDVRTTEILLEKMRLITDAVDASAAKEDVPDEAFREQLRRIAEEIALGCAVRRQDESRIERRAICALGERRVRDRDQRVANQLAEEATVIGLTERQWEFVVEIATRGATPGARWGAAPDPGPG